MTGRKALSVLLTALGALLALPAVAQTLYATSIRALPSGGSDKIVGNLYAVNLANATATLLAPIRLHGDMSVGITGLAVHPLNGLFYGITSPLSPTNPRSLVTIDPATGDADLIGPLGATGSDIAFDPHGTLYIWMPQTRQIGTVDLNTGAVHPLGKPGAPATAGGLAIDEHGIAYVTPGGAVGTLDRVDVRTGEFTEGPKLNGAPFATEINAMTFSPSGLLLALNSNGGSPASVRLITINTMTGAVSAIGSLPDDADALAFAGAGSRDIRSALATLSGRTLALLSLIVGLGLALAGMAIVRVVRRAER